MHVNDVLNHAEALDAVVIHNDNEVGEMGLWGEESRFPNGAFVAFAVAEQTEYAARAAVTLGGNGHSRGDGKTMAQRAGGKLDAGIVLVHDVAGERRAILVKSFKGFEREKTAFREHGIERGTGVTFAHDETIAVGPTGTLGVIAERPAVESRQEIRRGERGTDVRSVRFTSHAKSEPPDSIGKLSELRK